MEPRWSALLPARLVSSLSINVPAHVMPAERCCFPRTNRSTSALKSAAGAKR